MPSLRTSLPVAMGLLIALLPGCATPPARPVDLQANFARLAVQQLDDPRVDAELRRFGVERPAAGQSWTLDALTCAAWALRPEIAQAQAELRQSVAQSRGRLEKPNPSLNLTPEYFYDAIGGAAPWTVALALSSLLSPTPGRAALHAQDDALRRAATWTLAQTYWSLRSEVRMALIELSLRHQEFDLAHAETGVRKDAEDLAATIYALGASDKSAQRRAQAARIDAQARERAALHAQDLARARVAATVGVRAAELAIELPDVLDGAESAATAERSVAQDTRYAAIDRIEIARANAEYLASDAAWRLAVARRYPAISLGAGAGLDRGEHKLTADLGIELPLYHRHAAAIDEAAAARDVAVQRLEALQLQAIAGIESAHAALGAANDEMTAASAGKAAALQALSVEEQRRRAGSGDRASLIEARLAITSADRLLQLAQQHQIEALTQLENTLQRPLWPASVIDLQHDLPTAAGDVPAQAQASREAAKFQPEGKPPQ